MGGAERRAKILLGDTWIPEINNVWEREEIAKESWESSLLQSLRESLKEMQNAFKRSERFGLR